MAERRMFAKSIVLSDAFLDMPMSARCLYFTLSMFADDDGFVGSPKGIMRQCGASQDDIAVLLQKRFLLGFDSGVIVIKHWRINNYLQNDRHKPTTYIEELNTLCIDAKNAYKEKENPECIQNVSKMDTQYRIEEKREDESRIEENKGMPVRHKYGTYKNVLLSDKDIEKLKTEFPNDFEKRIEDLSYYIQSTKKHYSDHLATIRNWARRERGKQTEKKNGSNVFLDIAEEEGIF